MTARERILTVLERDIPDMVPWAFYSTLIPQGEVEREARNKGCGIILWKPAWRMEMQNIEISVKEDWRNERIKTTVCTYHTPLGDISEKIEEDPGYHSKWIKEYLIKNIHDYKIMRFIIENTHYYEDYNSFREFQEDLGEDGVIFASVGPSPLQRLLNELMGVERFSLDFYDHPKQVEELLHLIEEKQDKVFHLAANSPAKIVYSDDSVTGNITEPRLFKKYCLPFYNKQAELLHQKNKIYGVHMDGKLKCLRDLIKEAKNDLIDSFTLPEQGGDFPLEEARNIWEDKVIAINFPASISLKGRDEAKKFMLKLFKRIFPAKNFMVQISEDLPHMFWKDIILILGEIIPKLETAEHYIIRSGRAAEREIEGNKGWPI